ncbi:hypothetical protein [Pseudobacteriovorax antillogorgiicola]|uniref:Uncharacterized protein n=1 Tax=Pseudobacteriovorax antillogorgiicola TaxID=1513793 RepID=A0A1Y6CG08_9BACT|nr:hypothetical protein [Pseudobacteriovorax antillogorgiicola]TCS48960.1 hypothetical protein EDD56_1162 [Pseudobacteriovorax antillogorgiicola]SMF53687.1 hypothetical protein SAMN06296036_116152 [Pseudobacteriovorax antillogorgiicola]
MKSLTIGLLTGLLPSISMASTFLTPSEPIPVSVLKVAPTSGLPEINDPNATITFPVYNSEGKKIAENTVSAADVWPQMDSWTQKVEREYANDRNGPNVITASVWDNDLGMKIEDLRVPQDVSQRKKLEKQKENARRWKPQKNIAPQKLSTSLNRVFGNNSTFGAFQNGNFSSEGQTQEVKVSQSFSAGGAVFGKRITVINQTTKSDSKSKTTKSDIKVFDQSIFVSTDGTVKASKSVTRSKGASKVFVLGIIPVRVGGSVSGSIGANPDYQASGLSVEGSVAPFLNTKGKASAGVDLLLVVAGIEGSLTFVNNTHGKLKITNTFAQTQVA